MSKGVIANGLSNEVPTIVELFEVVGIDALGEGVFAKGRIGKSQHSFGKDGLQQLAEMHQSFEIGIALEGYH